MSKHEYVNEMEEAVESIMEAVETLKQVAQNAQREELISETEVYRLERGALSHIETSLSDDHHFLGGNMHTVRSTINVLKHAGECCSECGEQFDEVQENEWACPAGC